MNYRKTSFLILRLGLAATYVYSGLDLILHPTAWIAFVPGWFSQLLPVSTLNYLQFQGVVELILALGFIFGIGLRWVSFISAVEMLAILGLYGFDGVTFRDLAILGGSLSIFFGTFASDQTAVSSPGLVTAPLRNLSDTQKRFRAILVISAFILFSIILVGLFWLSNTTRDQAGWLAFSYATGLSMIVLPCTLPLAFVIVPLAMGKDSKKGLAIAAAFAIGVTITLSIYGAIIAKLGQVVGLDKAKDIMYTIAGLFAVVFGLGELGLIKMRVPTYSGAFPKFIQQRKDVAKGFLLGLLLGNVGLGCPNPAFYVLLSHIATVGDMATGWFLTFIHAVGRVTPLMLLAIMAVLGVDALSVLVKKKDSIAKATAWGVVFVGAFILTFGLLGHDWYVYSGLHSVLEKITQEASFMVRYADQFGGIAHSHELPTGSYLKYGSWLMVTLIVIPMIWNWLRKRPATDDRQAWKWMGAFVVSLALFMYLLFGITLPNWFRYKIAPAMQHEEMGEHGHAPGTPDEHEHEDSMMMDHENASDTVEIKLNAPTSVRLNRSVDLEFQVLEKTTGKVLTDLEVSHGEPMHVVGVRKEDMTQFFHIHPRLKGDRYVVTHTFKEAGTYGIWPGIVYKSSHIASKMPDLVVGTPPIISYLPAFDKTLRLEDDLVVALKSAPSLHAGQEHMLGFSITDGGGFDLPLGKYLEENLHINIISPDFKHYHHLHTNYGEVGGEEHGGEHEHSQSESNLALIPKVYAQAGDGHTDHTHGNEAVTTSDESGLFGEKDLKIRFTFPEPGNYKIFAEFVLASNPGKTERVEFWVQVAEAPAASKAVNLPSWALALISLVFIAVVLPIIHHYLREDNIKA